MITRITPKVLNSDSAETLLKPTEMMDAINIQLSGKDESSAGIVKSPKGNAVSQLSEAIAQYSAGKNTVIGTVSDENLGVIFFFVHNDEGNHGVYAYSAKTQTHRLIFKGSILNFEPNGFVKGDLVRIKRKSQDEEFTVVDPDTDFPGGGPVFETEEIVTVPKFFYYERDFSLLAETAKICLPTQLRFTAEPDTWDGTNVPVGMRAIVEISNDDTPHLGAFYPEAGDVTSPVNAEAFNNPTDYNTVEFDLSNTLGLESSNPDVQDQFNDFASIDAAVRSWVRNGAFQVNLHPDAASDPSTSIKVTLRVLNTETGDLDVAAIDSLSTGDQPLGSDTVWPGTRPAPINEFTYAGDDLLPTLVGDLDTGGTAAPNAFGHDTISELVRVVDAFYSVSPSVGGNIVGGLQTEVGGGATHTFADLGSRYHDVSSLVYSESDSSTLMGDRIVMTRVSIDFSQTEEWAEYKEAWQLVYDIQQPDQEDDSAARSGERSGLCDSFIQPNCDGWAQDPSITNSYDAYIAAVEYVIANNCDITVNSSHLPCGDGSIPLPDFNPGFLSIRSNNTVVSLHTPLNTTQLPDLEAALNGEFNVPDPATNATGVYDFLVPVQVSGPGYLYRACSGFAVVDASVFGGTASLNSVDVGEAIAEFLTEPGQMFLSAATSQGDRVINAASTTGEDVVSQEGGGTLTYNPRPLIARGLFLDEGLAFARSISEAIYDEITTNNTVINTWLGDTSSDYGNFTNLVFPNYTLNFTRFYNALAAAGNPDILEDKKDFCFGFFDNCESSGQRVFVATIDSESVVSETSTRDEREPSSQDDSPQERQGTPENAQPTPAEQAAQKSKTKTSRRY